MASAIRKSASNRVVIRAIAIETAATYRYARLMLRIAGPRPQVFVPLTLHVARCVGGLRRDYRIARGYRRRRRITQVPIRPAIVASMITLDGSGTASRQKIWFTDMDGDSPIIVA